MFTIILSCAGTLQEYKRWYKLKKKIELCKDRKNMKQVIKEGKCIVIGAGDLTVNRLDYNSETDCLIAVDGGIMYCPILEVEPDLIIGDFDSVNREWKEAIQKIQENVPEKVEMLCPEKDDTDMYAALKRGLEAGYRNFRIYEDAISEATGSKVKITNKKIEISYDSLTDLNRIMEILHIDIKD